MNIPAKFISEYPSPAYPAPKNPAELDNAEAVDDGTRAELFFGY